MATRGRHGSFVTARAAGASEEARRLAVDYAARSHELGVAPRQALELARAALGLDPEPTAPAPASAAQSTTAPAATAPAAAAPAAGERP
ncbi:hypothetical protein [Plantactinospora sp. KBS50]|uniref:hypothetical protein n=1 Tax=Plantactinospora sp. KBS50 TaxID=2024580 RepID=UPI00269F1019